MTEIQYQLSVSDQNGSITDINDRNEDLMATSPQKLPLMIDGLMKEDSPLGCKLRQIVKSDGYSINFKIEIDITTMSKSKKRRLRQKVEKCQKKS